VTGLIELIGIICLFGLAPVIVWKLVLQSDDVEQDLEEAPIGETKPGASPR
jgi:hypothetical protein